MKNAIDARISHLLTKLCSFRLVEAEAIAKKKQLEREARKLEQQAIANHYWLKHNARKLEKRVIAKEKQLEREARKLEKVRQQIWEQVPIHDRSEILRRLARVEAVVLESLLPRGDCLH